MLSLCEDLTRDLLILWKDSLALSDEENSIALLRINSVYNSIDEFSLLALQFLKDLHALNISDPLSDYVLCIDSGDASKLFNFNGDVYNRAYPAA